MAMSPRESIVFSLSPVRFNGLKAPDSEALFAPRSNAGLRSAENVVFFGNTLGAECQRCGAYNQTSMGHKFCAHISCPIALREFKRRKRKRTSSLEKVYIPQKLGKAAP